jgi:hypothetical protein
MSVTYTDLYETFGYDRIHTLADDPYYSGTLITSGALQTGYRYAFAVVGTAYTFTNVGADAVVEVGDYFYATGTTPTAWGGCSVYLGQSTNDIVNKALDDTRQHFNSIASFCGVTYTETDEVANAMVYYAMYLLYVRNQKFEEGADEKKIAYEILVQQWGDSVRLFLEGGQRDIEKDPILRTPTVVVTREDHAEYDEIDIDEQ